MKKAGLVALACLAMTTVCQAAAEVPGESFDVLGSVMETHKKEYDAREVLDASKEEALKYREDIIAGWWEFMQANSKAAPGEYCAASFLRARRLAVPDGEDRMKDGFVVTLFGPGGNYRGALLSFSPLGKEEAKGFPELPSGKPVLVTLKQGNIKPVTLNAISLRTRPEAPPLLAFAVPSIEALMQGMEDNWDFEVIYQDKVIVSIEWHDGLKARAQLQQCLAGEPFEKRSH